MTKPRSSVEAKAGAAHEAKPPAIERRVFKIFIRGPIEKVWHEITKIDEAQGCFYNAWLNTTGLRVGAPVQMRTRSGRFTLVIGEVTEFDPPHRYAHTFRFTTEDDPPCLVVYDLKSVTNGTEFTLTVENLAVGTRTDKSMTSGGTTIVKLLKSIVETGRPPLGTRIQYALMNAMEGVLPRKTRSENWPL